MTQTKKNVCETMKWFPMVFHFFLATGESQYRDTGALCRNSKWEVSMGDLHSFGDQGTQQSRRKHCRSQSMWWITGEHAWQIKWEDFSWAPWNWSCQHGACRNLVLCVCSKFSFDSIWSLLYHLWDPLYSVCNAP